MKEVSLIWPCTLTTTLSYTPGISLAHINFVVNYVTYRLLPHPVCASFRHCLRVCVLAWHSGIVDILPLSAC